MAPLATVAIISLGEMGTGIAKLLVAHNYRVVTNIEGRSADTHARAKKASVETLPTDDAVVSSADYILSIVPPRDALATAKRISTAFNASPSPDRSPLYYLDLNAISPRSAREISNLFQTTSPTIKFIDGGIIGGPPSLKSTPDSTTPIATDPTTEHTWNRPSIPISGPHELKNAPKSGAHLQETLNIKHISPEIGPASGLKCCFATTSKGFQALAIQSFTTAAALGVLPHLQEEMSTRMPGLYKAAGAITAMPPKAYRWVKEMEEIGVAHSEDGGFEGNGKGIFDAVAELYRAVAEDTVLGEEKTETRKRGKTVEDVAEAMGEGLRAKRRKND